jgi:5-methyltetrahydropteroyltriglutamate--homocysteine methyltransferase
MMTIEEFSYARGRARVPVKITMPSPLVMYGAWSPEHSRPAYSDPFELFADAADILRAEARELARLGCTYIQIDSPDLGTLVDPENRSLREGLGMDTERTLTEGVDIINSVADVPGVTEPHQRGHPATQARTGRGGSPSGLVATARYRA